MKATDINVALCKAFHLDPSNVSKVTIVVEADKWPLVTVEGRITKNESDQIAEATDQYQLVPVVLPNEGMEPTQGLTPR